MMKHWMIRIVLSFFLLQSVVTFAQQQPPFWKDIQAFKKTDSLHQQPKNAILFVGSSSFTLWKNIGQAFPKHTIINRGFGGSSLPHVIQYANDIIFPYQPKQVVVYCGENDLTVETVTADTVFQRFKELFMLIRSRLPDVHLAYVSMKPSPSRWHLKDKMERGNSLVKDFLTGQKNTVYVDVWKAMLNVEGKPMETLFVEDKLHMNEKGYAIWQKLIAPVLASPPVER
jgi:lysophospholipase L1-like esterase